MEYTLPASGDRAAFTMHICGAVHQGDHYQLRCISDIGHDRDHISAYGLFWADGMPPYRLGPTQRRGTNGTPEEMT